MSAWVLVVAVVAVLRWMYGPRQEHLEPLPLPPPPSPWPVVVSLRDRAPGGTVHDSLLTAQDGELVVMTGRLRSSTGTLLAPLSGTACIAYVAAARSRYTERAPPLVDVWEMKAAPFVLELTDGDVLIDGECTVELRDTEVAPRVTEREVAFLAKRQLQHFLPSIAFAETRIGIGDRIWVSGVLMRELSGEHGYRDSSERMRLVARPGHSLEIGHVRPS
jgi:hypothetical protein